MDILSTVVGKPPPRSSSEWIGGDLQNHILRFTTDFLCQYGDNASLKGVYKFLTCYTYLQERIKMDYFSLIGDLRLAVRRFPLEMTMERDIIIKQARTHYWLDIYRCSLLLPLRSEINS